MEENTQRTFHFPFSPYPIQLDFMNQLYSTLDKSAIGIFESPTGTGKSLSIICSSLQWLRDNSKLTKYDAKTERVFSIERTENSTPKAEDTSSVPDWAKAYLHKKKQEMKENAEFEVKEKLKKQETKLSILRDTLHNQEERPKKIRKLNKEEEWDDYLLEDIDSDDNSNDSNSKDGSNLVKKKLQELMEYDSEEEKEANDSISNEEISIRKIYYCSRTHSQLNQFINEIKKTNYGKDVKVSILGSRKIFCINEQVSKLKYQSLINDKCLDLQSEKKDKNKDIKTHSSCTFFNSDKQKKFGNYVHSKVNDIEDIVQLGKSLITCPYYGLRSSIQSSEIIALPYNILLHKDTRDSLGIQLEGNIVILDEAHNIIESINNMYSVVLNYAQLTSAHSQLLQYQEKYKLRLNPKNLKYVKEILFILQSYMKFISNSHSILKVQDSNSNFNTSNNNSKTKIMSVNDFLFDTRSDNLNMYKIVKYINKSNIVKKVNGFYEKYSEEFLTNISKDSISISSDEEPLVEKHKPALSLLESFLLSLSNNDMDGRILLTVDNSNIKKSTIRYLLLNPERHFTEVLKLAKSVILAGGTMHPMSDIISQLLNQNIPKEKIITFTCGHIIPKENILAVCLNEGPSGIPFDFTFKSRFNLSMIEELGRTILNLVNIVPDGVILFFPSYSYEDKVFKYWSENGVLARMDSKKKFIREPRSTSKIEDTLKIYQESIESGKGGILSCVIGGKLSEGINFSDGLGRCICVIGLPYPNPNDPVLTEKLSYMNLISQKLRNNNTSNNTNTSTNNNTSNNTTTSTNNNTSNNTNTSTNNNTSNNTNTSTNNNTSNNTNTSTNNNTSNNNTSTNTNTNKTISSDYYDNLCMRAVNQSIGRSIRHAKDYASIILIDQRYSNEKIISKLPKWIGNSLHSSSKFPQMFANINKFFKAKK